jgi:UDP-2,3-diacylglucosamine pyrophosphatase LpxH
MNVHAWTPEQLRAAEEVIRRFPRGKLRDALPDIAAATGRMGVTRDAVKAAFRQAGKPSPSTFMGGAECRSEDAPDDKLDPLPASMSALQEARREQYAPPEHAPDLVRMLRARALPLYEVCERMDLKPSELSAVVEKAREAGYHLAINDGWISAPKVPLYTGPRDFGNHKPGHYRHIVVSDLHVGSEYAAMEELSRFIEWGYQQGARVVHIPGDVLDGPDPRLIYEQNRVGFQRQAEHCIRHMPELEGLRYFACEGNHDAHTRDSTGISPGRALENEFRVHGRTDWHHVGVYRVRYRVDGASFLLYHPGGGASKKQNVVNHGYAAIDLEDDPPDFVFAGHLHKNVIDYCYKGSLYCACPTWQRQKSGFARRLSGKWDVGGMLSEYTVRDDGVVDGKGLRFYRADAFSRSPRVA